MNTKCSGSCSQILLAILLGFCLILIVTNVSYALYDANDGSIYSCNEGNTPKLCEEREQLREKQAKQQDILNKQRDIEDNLAKGTK